MKKKKQGGIGDENKKIRVDFNPNRHADSRFSRMASGFRAFWEPNSYRLRR
jgi:hypothetical protein